MDLLDRLITDLFAVTQTLMSSDKFDLEAWQPGAATSMEKRHSRAGLQHHEKHKATRPMSHGIHRGVC